MVLLRVAIRKFGVAHVAWCCSMLQYVSMVLPVLLYRRIVLQYVSMVLPPCCIVLFCVAIHKYGVARVAWCFSVLQYVNMVLLCVAIRKYGVACVAL